MFDGYWYIVAKWAIWDGFIFHEVSMGQSGVANSDSVNDNFLSPK